MTGRQPVDDKEDLGIKTKYEITFCFATKLQALHTEGQRNVSAGTVMLHGATIPVGICYQNDVILTSMRRSYVASTLIRRHFYAMCPLGIHLPCFISPIAFTPRRPCCCV